MSKRYNHYHVKIDFDKKRPECNIGNLYSEYMSGKTNKDSFHFLSNSFTLIASRSKMFVDGTILSNSTNSINSQLLKGLLYYYSLAKDFPNIKQISIIRKRAKIFIYKRNTSKEVDCMSKMRIFIINNKNLFTNTLKITNAYTNNELRDFRWRSLILNDYATSKKTKAFHDFILRYHDIRIMKLFNEILPYRIDFLNQENLFRNVQTHISSNTTLHDVELIPLLSIKYAYFVRNKMFHGEIPDSTFKIHKNNEDIEIDRLNDILSTLIFELLNNNDMLR